MTYVNKPQFIFDYDIEISDNPRYALINDIHYESASASSDFSVSEETDLIIVKKETTMLNHIKQYLNKIIDLVKSFL